MEPGEFAVVECKVQIFGQKVCRICFESNCWGEYTHEQLKEDTEKSEDFVLKTNRAAQ